MTDYRELLMKYMARVLDAEGVTFIDDAATGFDRPPSLALDDSELDELRGAETEMKQRFNAETVTPREAN